MSLRVDKYSLFTKSARKFGPYLPEMVSYFLYIDQEYIVQHCCAAAGSARRTLSTLPPEDNIYQQSEEWRSSDSSETI